VLTIATIGRRNVLATQARLLHALPVRESAHAGIGEPAAAAKLG
jgi:hypothetical protein